MDQDEEQKIEESCKTLEMWNSLYKKLHEHYLRAEQTARDNEELLRRQTALQRPLLPCLIFLLGSSQTWTNS